MKTVAKYNLYKGLSTFLTLGTPLITLASCSEFFVDRSSTAISAAGMFALLITLLFTKDKIMENFKMPSAFIITAASFVLIVMIENLLVPVKTICLASMITTFIDELTFKNWYKRIEAFYSSGLSTFKKFGFLFTTTEKIEPLKEK